jgi:hypothetical protein
MAFIYQLPRRLRSHQSRVHKRAAQSRSRFIAAALAARHSSGSSRLPFMTSARLCRWPRFARLRRRTPDPWPVHHRRAAQHCRSKWPWRSRSTESAGSSGTLCRAAPRSWHSACAQCGPVLVLFDKARSCLCGRDCQTRLRVRADALDLVAAFPCPTSAQVRDLSYSARWSGFGCKLASCRRAASVDPMEALRDE